MSDLCIECRETVSGRKHAVTCDACERWQHRMCNTGEINIFCFCSLHGLIFICFSKSYAGNIVLMIRYKLMFYS